MKKEKPKQPENKLNTYIKYSSLPLQMVATILILAFVGHEIDNYYFFEKPYITAVFSLFGVGIALYLLLKKI